MNKKKINGEVFTPETIIDYMVESNYSPKDVDFILEPGCGDGRFILKIIKKIISCFKHEYSIINEKIGYIYGIELDTKNYDETLNNIDKFLSQYPDITSRPIIINGDALLDLPNNIEWDLIIGNPPYVRIHNLPSEYLNHLRKNYSYLKNGMVDLYYGFFELHKRLSNKGKLCFITPSSYLYNSSGKFLFDKFYNEKLIKTIEDFGSLKMFTEASTYTCITTLCKNNNSFNYKNLNLDFSVEKQTEINYGIDGFTLSSIKQDNKNNGVKFSKKYKVKTGFATLSDKTFVITNFTENEDTVTFSKNGTNFIIEKSLTKKCVKASKFNGSFHRVIFPYKNVNGKNIPLLEEELRIIYPMGYEYLNQNKNILLSRDKGNIDNNKWFLWGRTQCINNTEGPKIIISPMFINTPFSFIHEDVLVYSGYFIINETFDDIFTDKIFIENLKSISKPMAMGWKSLQKKILDEVII